PPRASVVGSGVARNKLPVQPVRVEGTAGGVPPPPVPFAKIALDPVPAPPAMAAARVVAEPVQPKTWNSAVAPGAVCVGVTTPEKKKSPSTAVVAVPSNIWVKATPVALAQYRATLKDFCGAIVEAPGEPR